MHTVSTETHQSSSPVHYCANTITVFVASLVKQAAIHCVSVLPYFNSMVTVCHQEQCILYYPNPSNVSHITMMTEGDGLGWFCQIKQFI